MMVRIACLMGVFAACAGRVIEVAMPVDAPASDAVADSGPRDSSPPDAAPFARSTLPIPATPTNVAKPVGPTGKLRVLDWAGFTSANSWTFDDAQPSQIEHYSELEATGVRMTFYLTISSSSLVPNFDSTWAQAVADGHELGNHSVHHCHADLSGCSGGTPLPTLGDELDSPTAYITSHYPQPAVWTAASLYGDTGYDGPDQARFFLNRGVFEGSVGANDASDAFDLPCHVAATGETASSFEGAIDSARAARTWQIFVIHTITPTSAIWYNPVAITDITDSIAHAQSLQDVWTDSLVNVGAYWLGQRVFSAVTPSTSGASTTWSWALPSHFPSGKYLRVTVDGGTLSQYGTPLTWDAHGYYEIALDAGSLVLSP